MDTLLQPEQEVVSLSRYEWVFRKTKHELIQMKIEKMEKSFFSYCGIFWET